MKLLFFLVLTQIWLVKCRPDKGTVVWEKLYETKECKVQEIASNSLKPCQFPFIYKNQTYYGCTEVDAGANGMAWCSTEINPLTYEHIVGQQLYGDCFHDLCPTAEQGSESYENWLEISAGTNVGQKLLMSENPLGT